MIFRIMALMILGYEYFDYKKALMLFIIAQLIWHDIRLIPAIPIKINMLLSVTFLIGYFTKKHISEKNHPNPYAIPYILMIISAFASSITAYTGFMYEFPRVLSRYLLEIAIPWLAWKCFDKRDLELFFDMFSWVMLFACIYGLIETFILKDNPLLNYKVILSNDTINIYNTTSRGYRLVSIFEHPIGAGMTFALFSIITIYRNINEKIGNKGKTRKNITAILSIICVFLTKMRSSYIFLIISLISLIKKKVSKKILLNTMFIIFATIPVLILFINAYSDLFSVNRILNNNASQTISGSSFEMRIEQFKAVLIMSKESPLFGLGETFRVSYPMTSARIHAYGFESVWLEELVMHGLFGVITTIIMLIYSIIKIPRLFKIKEVAIISLAFWVTYTVTSIPGFQMIIYYLILYYYIKSSKSFNNIDSEIRLKKLNKRKIVIKVR